VLILAHRGLPSAERCENTVAAVVAAFAVGADGVEVDLRLTADGVLALCHDADLGRVTGGADRTQVASTDWPALTDAAARHGVRLARLEWLLAAAAGRRVVLELKSPPPGMASVQRTALAVAGQLRALQRTGLPLDVTISSFSPELAAETRRMLPPSSGVRTALLGRALDRPQGLLRRALAVGHDEVHPHLLSLLADPSLVRAAHSCGVAVVPWTVNRRRDLSRFARLGVDAVITDLPVAARAIRQSTAEAEAAA